MSTGLFTNLVFPRNRRSNYDILVRHQRMRVLRSRFNVALQEQRQPTFGEIDPDLAQMLARRAPTVFDRSAPPVADTYRRFGDTFAHYKAERLNLEEMIEALAPGDFAITNGTLIHRLFVEHLGGLLNETPCDHCGNIDLRDIDGDAAETSDVDGQVWCASCTEDDAIYSSEMGAYTNGNDAIPYYATVTAYRARSVTDYVTPRYGDNNLYVSDDGECFASEDVRDAYPEVFDPDFDDGYDSDDDDGDSDDTSDLISSYHSSHPRALSLLAKDGVNLGVELEIVSESQRYVNEFVDAFNTAANTGRNYYCGFERDGSLESDRKKGVEVVTGYGSLAAHKEHLTRVLGNDAVQDALDDMDADDSHCGMHVHITATAMTNIHKLKLDKFVIDDANRTIWRRVAMRDCDKYAAFKLKNQHGYADAVSTTAKLILKALVARAAATGHINLESKFKSLTPRNKRVMLAEQWQGGFDRYRALNWQKGHTVEFRMFKGTMDPKVIIARLELVRGLYAFTGQQNTSCMTWPCFIAWAEKPENICDMRAFLTWASKDGIIPVKDYYKPRAPRVAKCRGVKTALLSSAALDEAVAPPPPPPSPAFPFTATPRTLHAISHYDAVSIATPPSRIALAPQRDDFTDALTYAVTAANQGNQGNQSNQSNPTW